jgi:hypothetical protein
MGWFDDIDNVVRNLDDVSTITILTGSVSDQAAWHRLLRSIKELWLLLFSVRRMENQE